MHRRSFLTFVPAGLTAAYSTSLSRAQSTSPLTEAYRERASRLIGAALTDDGGWKKLEYLCDRIGNRIDGSPALMKAIDWAAGEMRREGLSNVQTPPVKVPHWVRGEESARLVDPIDSSVAMLGLGGSVGTPAEGITAEVIAVSNFDELEALGSDKVRGKIVLYNAAWQGYGKTVQYRTSGASRAAKLGAVASLVRSVTPLSLRDPHTGMMGYDAGVKQIPHAAVSVEDSLRIQRLLDAGNRVRLQLKMSAQTLPDADAANVIGEIPGREKPEEIVLLGGHIDSWDVGQGAQDDGCGLVACWQAVVLMKQLNLIPRRTVRIVGWVDEEHTGAGGKAYAAWAGDTVKNHVAAIEMDGGAERPVGYGLSIRGAKDDVVSRALARANGIGRLLDGIGAGEMTKGGGGADISPLMALGVPGFGHRTVGLRYFEWHHSEADTLDKIDPKEFRLNVASLAVLAYVLADMDERIDA
jgi:carboxypeptidase Q